MSTTDPVAATLLAQRNELAELRALLAGVPGDTLADQVRALLQDRERLDFIERQGATAFHRLASNNIRSSVDHAMAVVVDRPKCPLCGATLGGFRHSLCGHVVQKHGSAAWRELKAAMTGADGAARTSE